MKVSLATLLILSILSLTPLITLQAQTGNGKKEKIKILIHITCGPENPTRAALAFLIAKTAAEEGHSVSLFLAGDAVQLFREDVLNHLAGLGTGNVRQHYDAIVSGGGKFYLSGMSSKSRGVLAADLRDKPAEFAMPKVLLQLTVDSDRVLVY